LVVHSEIATPMRDQLVDFLKGSRVKEQLDPLPSCQFAAIVLTLPAGFAAPKLRLPLVLFERFALVH
jgi:hypothetical protein